MDARCATEAFRCPPVQYTQKIVRVGVVDCVVEALDWLCGRVIHCQSKDPRFKFHQLSLAIRTSFFLHLALSLGPSKILNWGPGLGWGRTRRSFHWGTGGTMGAHTTVEGHGQCSCECTSLCKTLPTSPVRKMSTTDLVLCGWWPRTDKGTLLHVFVLLAK